MNNHKAEVVIVTCIDFRLQEFINNWISKNFSAKAFDRVALAGGVKSLETILGQVDISVKLHHINRVILINHEDCGAYGAENFPDTEAEHIKHSQDLKNAKAKVKETYPDLAVENYYLHLDGTFEPIS